MLLLDLGRKMKIKSSHRGNIDIFIQPFTAAPKRKQLLTAFTLVLSDGLL